ncbi:MAG: helix-turn-helix transcriptional regulator [Erysipelotrichales bacterium]|nr:helix-turn-helix transcriptional regulator [Erysipelotrichales bacterium]
MEQQLPFLAGRIQQARKDANIPQEKLAALLYVDRKMISKWENGTSEPRISELERLASALNKPIAYFFEHQDSSFVRQPYTLEGAKEVTKAVTGLQNDLRNWSTSFCGIIRSVFFVILLFASPFVMPYTPFFTLGAIFCLPFKSFKKYKVWKKAVLIAVLLLMIVWLIHTTLAAVSLVWGLPDWLSKIEITKSD